MSSDWFVDAFRDRYLEVYPHRDLPSARAEVAGLLSMRGAAPEWGRTLDLGCGFGRHTLAMLEAGVDVAGMDLSAELLARRTTLAGAERIEGRLLRGDMRSLPFAPQSFDTVVCLFSSFGYFDDAGNASVLAGLLQIVKPGARVLLDVMNAARIRSTLVPQSERAVGDGVLIEERSLSEDAGRVRKTVTLRAPDGREERWREDVRLYDSRVLDALIRSTGATVLARHGDFDGRDFDADAPRQLVWIQA